MNKLYRNLAMVNMKNNRQFYLPYFLTGIVSAAMFYVMVSMANNPGLMQMAGGTNVRTILVLGIYVVGFFSSIFLFYTNSFIIRRRKKEFGVFNILGMEKRHIAKVLILETLFTAVVAIGGGILSGLVFHKFLTMLLYRITGLSVSIPFYISTTGCFNTLLLFGIIYAAALFYNLMQIKLANPVELLRSGSAGEREPKTRVLMTVFGVLCLGSGYYIAITTVNAIQAMTLFFVAVILVIIGTYFLFTSGSIALLKLLRKNKNYYYKTRHFTTVSGMIYRMKQNAVGLANICILSTMVLVTLSTTVSMYIGIDDELDARYPSEITATLYYDSLPEKKVEMGKIIEDSLKESGRVVTGNRDYLSLSFSAIKRDESFESVRTGYGSDYEISDVCMVSVLPKADYERYSGEKIAELSGNEVAVAASPHFEEEYIKIGGQEFKVKESYAFPDAGEQYFSIVGGACYVIVPDEQAMNVIFETLKAGVPEEEVSPSIYHKIEFDIDGTPEEKLTAEAAVHSAASEWEDANRAQYPEWGGFYIEARQEASASFYTLYGGMFFLGIFLGTMFLMVTVLIIFYKQISEGYEDKERFAIMEKVGMSNTEVKASIRSQILTVFFLPIAAAVIHVAFAFPMITRILAMLNLMNVPLIALCLAGTALVFFIIYLLVFWLTSKSYYKIVGNQVS